MYGLLAEFEEPEALLEAAGRAYQEGYRKLDAYSPFPLEDWRRRSACGAHAFR